MNKDKFPVNYFGNEVTVSQWVYDRNDSANIVPNPAYKMAMEELKMQRAREEGISNPMQLALLKEKEVAKIRPAIQDIPNYDTTEVAADIYYRLYEGDFQGAYDLYKKTGVSITDSKDFHELLENIIDDVLILNNKLLDCSYLRILYMLGGNFNVRCVRGLEDFILAVFNHYRDNYLEDSSSEPLKKLIRQFGKQVNFNMVEEDLK